MEALNEIRFIKPCRGEYETFKQLTPEYAFEVWRNSQIVQINLDNCSLQRMEMLPDNPSINDVKEVGLFGLVEILQTSPVSLIAGGIYEMPDRYIKQTRLAYESFCREFWPSHKDDIAATYKQPKNNSCVDKNIEFADLDIGGRSLYGISYVSLLQIQNIRKKYSSESPEKQFEIYLHSIIGLLNVVSGYELEIAKYIFWSPNMKEINSLPLSVKNRRKAIVKNFKVGTTLQKCKHLAFNGANDMTILRGANYTDELKLSLKTVSKSLILDNWVGTNDDKLFEISKDIHSVEYKGSKSRRLSVAREDCLSNTSYWRFVDRLSQSALKYRASHISLEPQHLLQQIDKAVLYIENELA